MTTRREPIIGQHFIAGKWRGERNDFASLSPSNLDEIIGKFPVATSAEADEAIHVAQVAFPTWRRMSRIARGELFDNLAQLIKRDRESLSELMARECGKNITECRAEVIEGLHMVQYVFGSARMPIGELLASEITEKDLSVRRKPWGVVAVITPWNFPFAVPLWMLGPSLLEGNTCIFKPSEDTPGIAQKLVELFREAGFPDGVINLLHGDGNVGEAIVKNPGVNVICFTGSYAVGKRIQEVSANFFNRTVAAEMGSKSAVIVCEDARFDLAVTAGIVSAFKTTGQRCVSAGRILVHESLIDRYAKAFAQQAQRIKFGDPLDPNNFAGPLINRSAVEKVIGYNELARSESAKILFDGGSNPTSRNGKSCFLTPFVYQQNYSPTARTIREEVFGPHVALIPFKSDDEAVQIYNDTDFGLSMAVITESYRRMKLFREECEFGMGYVNLPCIGAEVHLPFGGVKKSGNGHPSAAGLAEVVTHKSAWTVNHGSEIKMAQGLTTNLDSSAEQ